MKKLEEWELMVCKVRSGPYAVADRSRMRTLIEPAVKNTVCHKPTSNTKKIYLHDPPRKLHPEEETDCHELG